MALGAPQVLNTGNSIVALIGSDLSATPTTLSFNFDDTSPSAFLAFGSSTCFPCAAVYYIPVGGSVTGTGQLQLCSLPDVTTPACAVGTNDGISERSGTLVIANATPLPAALPLFASGLGALGLLARRRKRKAAAIAA